MPPNTPTSRAAANVRAEMARRNIRRAAVAANLGMTTSSFSRRLTGAVPFNVEELDALARLLDVTVPALLAQDTAA